MSNVNENDRDPQSPKEPTAPMPRGGGDISGKGISEPSGRDEQGGGEAGDDEVAADGGS